MEFTKDIYFSSVLRENKKIEITYSGDLYKKNSEFLAIVYGFGEDWKHTTEATMTKTENGFTAEIEMKPNFDTFNFCFRNGNYEWDNNQTFNYISAIQPSILEVSTIEVPEISVEPESTLDSDLILEILDSIFEENISNKETSDFENNSEQQIFEDTLFENEPVVPVQSPVLAEEFDLDELIDNILNSIVHTTSETSSKNIVNCEQSSPTVQENLKQDLENAIANLGSNAESTIQNVESTSKVTESDSNTALIPTSEDSYLVSPRKLSKFYLFTKKVKLAFYKLFVRMPKLVFGNLEENKN